MWYVEWRALVHQRVKEETGRTGTCFLSTRWPAGPSQKQNDTSKRRRRVSHAKSASEGHRSPRQVAGCPSRHNTRACVERPGFSQTPESGYVAPLRRLPTSCTSLSLSATRDREGSDARPADPPGSICGAGGRPQGETSAAGKDLLPVIRSRTCPRSCRRHLWFFAALYSYCADARVSARSGSKQVGRVGPRGAERKLGEGSERGESGLERRGGSWLLAPIHYTSLLFSSGEEACAPVLSAALEFPRARAVPLTNHRRRVTDMLNKIWWQDRPITAALLAPAMLMEADTTDPSYWLNWKFLLCATWVYSCMALACYLIWKYEGPSSPAGNGDAEQAQQSRIGPGVVYLEDCWKPCLKQIHPAWLLAFRLVSFFVMASILTYDVIVDGWTVFLYYTQWTFLLVTLYFGLGSVLSIYGCYQYAYKTSGDGSDADHGSYIIAPTGEGGYDNSMKTSSFSKTHDGREIAGFWGYLFQFMFQTNAGAVMITDLVFWFILYPFLARNQYHMNFLLIGTHSINVVFIIGDTALNSLRFPWFRISYFMLWTGLFVSVQWIIHANVSIWWPYPFLDLTYPGAPVWYLVVALLHLPCYGLFALVLRLKQSLLQRWFSDSYTYVK